MKRLILAAVALVALAFTAQATHTQTRAMKGASKLSTQEFVTKAAVTNMFELEAARLAEQKATEQPFKKFAQMITDDHTKMGNELKSKVKNIRGVQLPSALDREHQQMLQQLKTAASTQFEQKYRTNTIQVHQKAIRLFEDYAQSGENSELKSWAQASIGTLQTHLQRAEALPRPVAGM